MSKNAITILAALVVLAVGLGVAAVYRGAPAQKSVAGPDAAAAAAARPSAVVKYLKPCEPHCKDVPTFAVREEQTASGSGLVLEQVQTGSTAPCQPECYTLVDQPDGTCKYKVILDDAGVEVAPCTPDCRYRIEPCAPDC